MRVPKSLSSTLVRAQPWVSAGIWWCLELLEDLHSGDGHWGIATCSQDAPDGAQRQNHYGSLCTMAQGKNHSDENKDVVLQAEQQMLSARLAAGIGIGGHTFKEKGWQKNQTRNVVEGYGGSCGGPYRSSVCIVLINLFGNRGRRDPKETWTQLNKHLNSFWGLRQVRKEGCAKGC